MDSIKKKDGSDATINPTASDVLLPQSSPLDSPPPAVFFSRLGGNITKITKESIPSRGSVSECGYSLAPNTAHLGPHWPN